MEGSVGLAFQGEGREQLVLWWGQQVPRAQGAHGGVAGFEAGEFGWGGSQRASWTSLRRLDFYPVYPARRHLLFSTGNEMLIFGFQQDWKQGSQLGVCICCLGKRSRGRWGWGRGRGEREVAGLRGRLGQNQQDMGCAASEREWSPSCVCLG